MRVLTHRLLRDLQIIKLRVSLLTNVFRDWVEFTLSLVVQKQIVHLDIEHHHVGGGQLSLRCLDHHHLLGQTIHLTEGHVRVHSLPLVKILFRTTGEEPFRILEPLFESSIEHHF